MLPMLSSAGEEEADGAARRLDLLFGYRGGE
jgi:hypothetical protein